MLSCLFYDVCLFFSFFYVLVLRVFYFRGWGGLVGE